MLLDYLGFTKQEIKDYTKALKNFQITEQEFKKITLSVFLDFKNLAESIPDIFYQTLYSTIKEKIKTLLEQYPQLSEDEKLEFLTCLSYITLTFDYKDNNFSSLIAIKKFLDKL